MNTIIAIIGALLIVIAMVWGMISYNQKIESGEIPKHGDIRMVKTEDKFYIQKYIAYPEWVDLTEHQTLDEAIKEKLTWDKIINRKEPEVIKNN